MRIERFIELPSTQDYARSKREEKQDLVVIADRQTGGRGTKGRSFSSNEGGIYLSKLTFYDTLPAKRAFEIMAGAAVAACEALDEFGLRPVIKWPNDIHVDGLKICGILVENVFSGDRVISSVVGLGLNVRNELPRELAGIATSMKAAGCERSVDEVREVLLERLSRPTDMASYQKYLGYMGSAATLLIGDERIPATLLSVDNEGGLWVRIADGTRRLTAAEVSVRV